MIYKTPMEPKKTFTCSFCDKLYKVESAFRKHRCKEMERAEIIKSIDGISAYSYYCEWMKCNGRNIPSIETFTESRFFTSFLKFTKYVKQVNLFKPADFVRFINSKKIDPCFWTNNECYTLYTAYLERELHPYEQAQNTVSVLFTIAEIAEKSVSSVFDILHPREMIELIRERKLSPWVLLCSRKFKAKMSEMDEETYRELTTAINVNYWAYKLEEHPEYVADMKRIADELGI